MENLQEQIAEKKAELIKFGERVGEIANQNISKQEDALYLIQETTKAVELALELGAMTMQKEILELVDSEDLREKIKEMLK